MQKISLVGLGKLGLPIATFFASRSFEVLGVDVQEDLVSELNRGLVVSDEPGLRELFASCRDRLTFGTSVAEAVRTSDVTFILVPTPSLPSGAFSAEYVLAVAKKIGEALREKSNWHLVVLMGTVMPGTTESIVVPAIESASEKLCGRDFGFCYSPEFVALGSVLHDEANPDFILVGESDERSGDELERFYRHIHPTRPVPVARLNFVNAELAKISLNAFVTTKISFANQVAGLCERYPGLNVDEVLKTIGLDSRIGIKYLKGGLGYGGPCFPRDNVALCAFARASGAETILAQATDQTNRVQTDRIIRRIFEISPDVCCVAVLGLSYKSDTHVVEESQGVELAQKLLKRGVSVSVYDLPKTEDAAGTVLGNSVHYARSLKEAVAEADCIIVALTDKRFIPSRRILKGGGNDVLIVDPWRIISPELFPKSKYYGIGIGPSNS